MKQNELIWRMAGGSGDGQITMGQYFAKSLMRSGRNVFTHQHYTSRIRGGHIFVEVRAAPHQVKSRGNGYNFLVALGDSFARNPSDEAYYGNEEIQPLTDNLDDLREGGVIIYDEGLIDIADIPDFNERVKTNDWQVYPLDLRGLAREHGREVMRNAGALGATAALLELDPTHIKNVLKDSMGDDIVDANLEVFEAAYELVKDQHDPVGGIQLPEANHVDDQVMISGSHAIAYGALDAGCRFVAGYPMTPWTDVFTIMSQNLPKFDGVAEQVEDEIAAASMAVGASHAGVKAMSGSSGGGFALMSEPLGLAEMTETPLVLIEAQRAGPSTGMPTKPEQSDLEHVLYTSQGDSNRVVLAPGNINEAYEQTREAFEIAYEYQIPTILLIDQKLSSEYRNLSEDFFDREPNSDAGSVLTEQEIAEAATSTYEKFQRYRHDAENGVSPRAIPGQSGGRFLATGNEHNEWGHISEDPHNRVAQMNRRMSKLDTIYDQLESSEYQHQCYHGPEDADYGILTWGSQQGTVEEAIDLLNGSGHSVKSLSVSQLQPYPATEVTEFLDSVSEAIVVEMNYSSQFRGLTQKELGKFGRKLSSVLKYDGNPFEPREVVEGFHSILGNREAIDGNRLRVIPAAAD